MSFDPKADQDRPYIGKVWLSPWTIKSTQKKIMGIKIAGMSGIAAHLDKSEAYELANTLVDLADTLPDEAPLEPTRATQAQREHACGQPPAHTLTNASGDVEQPLPTTPAESE
ncbi:MAG: hypothetical protein ACTIKH_02910 [Glutamicibacter ardleyensis]|uniref:hypothetical protein n=1 Tax=Glutamicibacter ardleyensis TaxID=225894 RepID=UPI003F987240